MPRPTSGRPVTSSRSVALRYVEGAALGIALWCMLFAFQLLAGVAADTWGIMLFAIGGVIAAASKARRILTIALAVLAGLVLLVTLTPISNYLASRWVRADPLPAGHLPAVVVLSESVNPNGTMTSGALDLLLFGISLVREGKASALVTTSVERDFPGMLVSSGPDQARIIALAAPEVKWLHTGPTGSTRDEATASARVLTPLGIRDIGVVASPMHTRRACSAFEAVGFTVTCMPARVRSPGGRDPAPWPADRLHVFGEWVYELAGMVKYRAAGWLANRETPEF